MSAALYLSRRGHKVTLAEKEDHWGGQFTFAWQAPGKERMKETLDSLVRAVQESDASIQTRKTLDASLVKAIQPDLLVWAVGAVQNIPEISGLKDQHVLTSLEYFHNQKAVRGPRVLVIGAGRVGLEIAEKLGQEGYHVVATKRTDPIGSAMEMITRTLILKRIAGLENVVLMPHTTVKAFMAERVDAEQDGVGLSLLPFNTVILASGLLPAAGPGEEIRKLVPNIEIIGDALEVLDIYSATHAGYQLALKY